MSNELVLNILLKATDQASVKFDKAMAAALLAQERIRQANLKTQLAQERLQQAQARRIRTTEEEARAERAAAAETEGFGSKLGGVASGLLGVVSVATDVVRVVADVGMTATKMSGDFEQAANSLVAHAGLVKSQVGDVEQSVLRLAPAVGRAPTQLMEALYPILSSFSDIQNQSAKTALSLQTLKLSFQTVAGTTTDGTAVANTAVSVFHALGLATNDVATNSRRMNDLFDLMDKSVQDGNMSWDAYRGTIGKVALAIQGTKISFIEANAALDVMTASGFPSARQAGTALSNLLTEMVIKQDTVATKAKKMGLSFNAQAFNAMSLADRITYLNKVTGGNQAEILKLLSGSSVAEKAFNALSKNAGKYTANLNDLNHAHGALAASFDTASQGFNQSMARLKAAFDVILIQLGTRLLPVFTQIINRVTPLVASFADWAIKNHVVEKALDALAGGGQWLWGVLQDLWKQVQPVVAQFEQWAIKNHVVEQTIAAAQLAVQWLGDAIKQATPVVGQIIRAYAQFYSEIADRVLPIIRNVVTWFRTYWPAIADVVKGVWDEIVGIIKIAWALVSGIIKIALDVLSGNWKQAWEDMKQMLAGVWEGIKQTIKGGIENVTGMVKGVLIHFGLMKDGIDQSTEQAKKQSQLHMLQMKDDALKRTGEMEKESIKHLAQMSQGIIKELEHTKDPAKRHALEMKLNHIHQVVEMKEVSIQRIDEMRKGIEDKMTSLKTQAGSIWKGLVTTIQNIVSGAVKWLKDTWERATHAVADAFLWLYNHNYYFKALVDTITNVIDSCVKWLKNAWTTAVKWIVDKWNGLKDNAAAAWNAVSNVFAGIWNNSIGPPLTSLWNSLSGWFGNLATQAMQWGTNLITGFITGIKDAAGGVGKAVGDVAQNIAKFLGFHSPTKEGPGATADQWAPAFIKMFSGGLLAGVPHIEKAALALAQPLARHHHGGGTHHHHHGGGALPPTGGTGHPDLWGAGLLKVFAASIASSTPRALQAAEGMMDRVQKVLTADRFSIELHKKLGDISKGRMKILEQEAAALAHQLALYKQVARAGGYRISTQLDGSNIDYLLNVPHQKTTDGTTHRRRHGGGLGSGAGGSYGLSGGGSSGNITILNVTIQAEHIQDDRELAKFVRNELGELLRRRAVA